MASFDMAALSPTWENLKGRQHDDNNNDADGDGTKLQ